METVKGGPMGPLSGKRIIEIAGIGLRPFCAMLLSDLGAEVMVVDRAPTVADELPDFPSLPIY